MDSFGIEEGKAKSANSLLMHSMYAVADVGNGPEIFKLYVEEMNDPSRENTTKRAYQLQKIERQQLRAKGSSIGSSPVTSTADIQTVADLFAAVKQKDANFLPKAVTYDRDKTHTVADNKKPGQMLGAAGLNREEKQEVNSNERREEKKEAFDRRTSTEALRKGQKGRLAYAYRPYMGALSQNAQAAKEGLKKIGVPVVVFEKMEGNKDGLTTIYRNDALAIPGVAVFIHKDATVAALEIVGHEGFHFLTNAENRASYISALVDNIDFASAAFIAYQTKYVQENYFEEEVGTDSDDFDLLTEEIYAYITGDIHSGDPRGEVHKFLRDYDAVKAAWDALVESQTKDKPSQEAAEEDALRNAPQTLEQMLGAVDPRTLTSKQRAAVHNYQTQKNREQGFENLLQQEQDKLRQLQQNGGSVYDIQKTQNNIRTLEQKMAEVRKALGKQEQNPVLRKLTSALEAQNAQNVEKSQEKTLENNRTYDRISADERKVEGSEGDPVSGVAENNTELTDQEILTRINEFLDDGELSSGERKRLSSYEDQKSVVEDINSRRRQYDDYLNKLRSRRGSETKILQVQERISELDRQNDVETKKLQRLERSLGIKKIVRKAKRSIYKKYQQTAVQALELSAKLEDRQNRLTEEKTRLAILIRTSLESDLGEIEKTRQKITEIQAEIENLRRQIEDIQDEKEQKKSLAGAIIDPADREILLFDNKKVVTVNGKRVIFNEGLFDPEHIDLKGRTNCERMARGLAPVGNDGRPLNIHHIDQTENGIVMILLETTHQKNSGIIHFNTGQASSQINRQAFNKWRNNDWKEISERFNQTKEENYELSGF